MTMMLSELADALASLKTLIMGKPSFEWGTIESVSPLLVSTDSDPTLVAGAGSTVPLVPGARVRLERQGPRLTVVGLAGGKHASGRITVTGVSITVATVTSGIYRSDPVDVPIGITPPPGWVWALTVSMGAYGWTVPYSGMGTSTPSFLVYNTATVTGRTAYVAYQLVPDN